MTREHAPRPGVTWQQDPGRREDIEPPNVWAVRLKETPSRQNRADRRAAMRALRKKGRQR